MVFNYFIELYGRVINRFTRESAVCFIMTLAILAYFYIPVGNRIPIYISAKDCESSSRPLALCQVAESSAYDDIYKNTRTFKTLEECKKVYRYGGCTDYSGGWSYPRYKPVLAGFSVTLEEPEANDHSWGTVKGSKYEAYYIRAYYPDGSRTYRSPHSEKSFKRIGELPARHSHYRSSSRLLH